jgi:hypothetical protein
MKVLIFCRWLMISTSSGSEASRVGGMMGGKSTRRETHVNVDKTVASNRIVLDRMGGYRFSVEPAHSITPEFLFSAKVL